MILLNRLRLIPAVILAVLAFTACDDDFNTIGGELIGGQLDGLPKYEAGVQAYNKKINSVQTNNLPAYLLGVYNDPVYGVKVANVLAPLALVTTNPNFGNEPRLDSVVLNLPYYSTILENDAEGNPIFQLDSVFGDSPFKLSVSRSDFYLNEFDPETNFENRQRYYSDQGAQFESNLVGEPLYSNTLTPSAREVVFRQLNEQNQFDTVRVAPRIRIHLPVEFFQENIIDKEGSTELGNNNNFRNFLRGLYLKSEPINGDGSMVLLNFSDPDAGIQLYYTNTNEVDDETVESHNVFRLTFGNGIVNTFEQNLPAQIEQEIASSSDSPGAANLFLSGGAGTMAVIDLFEDEAEIQELKNMNMLINEANLTFYVNQDRITGGEAEPSRLMLYDLDNNRLLLDYSLDPTAGTEDSNRSVTIHAPLLIRGENGHGIYYKIRITRHVREILENDAPNVKLGLVVTQNINVVNNAVIRAPEDEVTRIPSGSLMTPKGTILHGNLSPDDEKRLKFNIFYSRTSN